MSYLNPLNAKQQALYRQVLEAIQQNKLALAKERISGLPNPTHSPPFLYFQALDLYHNQALDESIATLETCLNLDLGFLPAWKLGSHLALQQKDQQKTLFFLDGLSRYLEPSPEKAHLLYKLFHLSQELEENSAAQTYLIAGISVCQTLLAQTPHNASWHWQLAQFFAQLKSEPQLSQHLQTAAQLNPDLKPQILKFIADYTDSLTPYRQICPEEDIRLSRSLLKIALTLSSVPPLSVYQKLGYLYTQAPHDFVKAECLSRQAIAAYSPPAPPKPYIPSAEYLHYYTLAEALIEQDKPSGPEDLIDLNLFHTASPEQLPLFTMPPLEWRIAMPQTDQPILFQGSDPLYFFNHTLPQILSLIEQKLDYHVHLHTFGPPAKVPPIIERLKQEISLSWSVETPPALKQVEKAFYYCNLRFSRLYQIAQAYPGRYIHTDADIVFCQDPTPLLAPFTYDVALQARPRRTLYDHYNASFVVFNQTPKAQQYLKYLDLFMRHNLAQRHVWMLDQIGLYGVKTWCEKHQPPFKSHILPQDMMGFFDYRDNQYLWTAGGSHKSTARRFTQKQQDLLKKYGFQAEQARAVREPHRDV